MTYLNAGRVGQDSLETHQTYRRGIGNHVNRQPERIIAPRSPSAAGSENSRSNTQPPPSGHIPERRPHRALRASMLISAVCRQDPPLQAREAMRIRPWRPCSVTVRFRARSSRYPSARGPTCQACEGALMIPVLRTDTARGGIRGFAVFLDVAYVPAFSNTRVAFTFWPSWSGSLRPRDARRASLPFCSVWSLGTTHIRSDGRVLAAVCERSSQSDPVGKMPSRLQGQIAADVAGIAI